MARQGKETLEHIERDIRENYATCYYCEDSRTNSGEVPKEVVVEPAKLLDRFEKAKRYVWMVTIDGSSYGVYENAASACLFATEKEAIDYVNEQLAEIVVDNVLCGIVLSFEVIGAAIEKHCKWFGKYEAQFRDGDSVTDFKIERTAVPNPPKKKRRKS